MRVEAPKAMYQGRFDEVNADVVAEYRANDGQLTTALAGAPILLLNHRGARSGTAYTSPLAFTRHGDAFVIVASMGGAPVDPQWFRDVVANPELTVESAQTPFRLWRASPQGRNARIAIAPTLRRSPTSTTTRHAPPGRSRSSSSNARTPRPVEAGVGGRRTHTLETAPTRGRRTLVDMTGQR